MLVAYYTYAHLSSSVDVWGTLKNLVCRVTLIGFFVRSKKTVNEAKLKFGYFDYIQFWMETFLKSISQIRGIKKNSNLPKKSLNWREIHILECLARIQRNSRFFSSFVILRLLRDFLLNSYPKLVRGPCICTYKWNMYIWIFTPKM